VPTFGLFLACTSLERSPRPTVPWSCGTWPPASGAGRNSRDWRGCSGCCADRACGTLPSLLLGFLVLPGLVLGFLGLGLVLRLVLGLVLLVLRLVLLVLRLGLGLVLVLGRRR
jgi:hypothetical protein